MNSNVIGARLGVLSVSMLAACAAYAQGSLQEVVVTASRNPQALNATSAHTTVITRTDIENSQAVDVVSLLQMQAGLQRTQNGGLGTTSTLFMRGLPSLDTLVLIDGVPQTKQDASGAVSLEHIMLDNVERIEVVRGNVSAIYGSGAIGGVIQIFTRSATKESTATLSLELGPRNTSKASGNATLVAGDTTLNAGVSRLTTDGYSAINTQQYAFANPDDDGYQNTSSNLSLSHRFSPDHRIGLQLVHSAGEGAQDSNYRFSLPTDVHRSTADLNQASIYSDDQFGRWRSHIGVTEQSERDTFVEHGSYDASYGFNMRTQVLQWINTLALWDNWLGTAGFEEQQQHVDTTADDGTPPYDINRVADAVFVGLEGSLGPFSLQLNLRNDKIGAHRRDTGYLGLGYALSDALKLTASSSTAFNAPPLGYLYDPYSGNPNLRPEWANSKELGIQYSSGGQLVRATYFDTWVQDQLQYDFTSSQFTNVSQARNTGLEVSYQGRLAAAEVRASATRQNPVDESTGLQLARRARTMASWSVTYPSGAWRTGVNLRYVGAREDSYTNASTGANVPVTLAAYGVVDATLSYRYSPQWLFTARLDNALDKSYQTVYGYNQQPRSLFAGVRWTPQR